MRTTPRSTRRTASAQLLPDKENLASAQGANALNKKARHRLSTTELARLEDVFRKETHPSRQQKKDLAAELKMDYKTVTIWFQNKRQTSKRGQPPPTDSSTGQPRSDSCLRAVSSPSHNATLDASGVVPTTVDSSEGKATKDGLKTITTKAIVKIRPLIGSLNTLVGAGPRGYSEPTRTNGEATVQHANSHWPRTPSESSIVSVGLNRDDPVAEQDQTKAKPPRWRKIRTLEWACERQAKRRKLSKEGYARLASEEVQDQDVPNDGRMDSALSLLSLASSTSARLPKDVVRGASLLLSFKHSWRRKQQVRPETISI